MHTRTFGKEQRMTTAQALPARQKRAARTRLARALLSVMGWEIRRLRASRLNWAIPFVLFGVFLADFVPAHSYVGTQTSQFEFAKTSALGLVNLLSPRLLLLLALLLPFVNADGVARDWKRRTHELLMTTPLPGWAYVWGRYLTGLLLSLGMAVMLLAAVLAEGVVLSLSDASYPAPLIGNILALWAVNIVPPTIVLSSVSFALGTWLPQRSTIIKIAILLVWLGCAGAFTGLPSLYPLSGWQLALDPTSNGWSTVIVDRYRMDFYHQVSPTMHGFQALPIFLALENRLPDLGTWLAGQLAWVGLSVALVLLAAVFFKRFHKSFQ